MTTTYERTNKNCVECREPVEDHTGHWEASEATLCDDCYDDYIDEWQCRVDVVHCMEKQQ